MCCVLVTCAAGEDVGFEELKLMEVSYAASVGLGNPAHFDRKDAHQCFAWWVRAMPHTIQSWRARLIVWPDRVAQVHIDWFYGGLLWLPRAAVDRSRIVGL